jgi:hypothetical protein
LSRSEVAFEGDDVGVVYEPADRRGGDDVFAENLPPSAAGVGLPLALCE